jgi:hypothetical protein
MAPDGLQLLLLIQSAIAKSENRLDCSINMFQEGGVKVALSRRKISAKYITFMVNLLSNIMTLLIHELNTIGQHAIHQGSIHDLKIIDCTNTVREF